jgi:hypothetical protein
MAAQAVEKMFARIETEYAQTGVAAVAIRWQFAP